MAPPRLDALPVQGADQGLGEPAQLPFPIYDGWSSLRSQDDPPAAGGEQGLGGLVRHHLRPEGRFRSKAGPARPNGRC
jgi:hypothetical protein